MNWWMSFSTASNSHERVDWRYGNIVRVDVVGSLFVVGWEQFETRMVVGKNVSEAIFGPVDRQIGRHARLIPSDVLQTVEFFRKEEIWIGGHTTVVLGKVLQFHRPSVINPIITIKSFGPFESPASDSSHQHTTGKSSRIEVTQN